MQGVKRCINCGLRLSNRTKTDPLFRGLAETTRWILHYGGVDFEDIRAPWVDNEIPPTPLPTEIKEKCTWGQVPLMEFEGKKLSQSLAITRYFAKKFDLVGSDDFEAALCDEYVDSCREFASCGWWSFLSEKDPKVFQEKLEEAKKTAGEKYLVKFSKILEANGGQRLVGKKFTWADIYLTHVINNVENIHGIDILKDYPVLKAHSEIVFAVPQIKAWVEKRPKTKF